MSDIRIEKQNPFDFQTSRNYAKKWLSEVENRLGLTVEYIESDTKDIAKINKAGVEAHAELTEEKLVFEAKLGLFAKPLKGAIESGVLDGLNKYFNK